VQEQGLEDKEKTSDRAVVGAVVEVGGVEAIIPNIDEIEQRLIKLHLL